MKTSQVQFSLVRIMLGVHFFIIWWLVFSSSHQQLVSLDILLPYVNYKYDFLNFLIFVDNTYSQKVLPVFFMLCALCLGLGFKRKWSSLATSFGWSILIFNNPIRLASEFGFLVFLLVLFNGIPEGEVFSLSKLKKNVSSWAIHSKFFFIGWYGFCVLEFGKLVFYYLGFPQNLNKSSFFMFETPHFSAGFIGQFIQSLPAVLTDSLLWIHIGFQTLSLLFVWFHRGRQILWVWYFSVFLTSFFILENSIMIVSYLVILIFLMDASWWVGKAKDKNILFFDGVCNLCNSFIDLLVQEDQKHRIKFAPLQGSTSEQLLGPEPKQKLESLVFYQNGKSYLKSSAFIRIALQLGGIWKFCFVLYIVPKFLRDIVYDFVARNRYKIFGERATCRLPSAEERKLFLD